MSQQRTTPTQRPHVHVHHDIVAGFDVPNAQITQEIHREVAEMRMSPSHEVHQRCQTVWQKGRLDEGEHFLLHLAVPEHNEHHRTRLEREERGYPDHR